MILEKIIFPTLIITSAHCCSLCNNNIIGTLKNLLDHFIIFTLVLFVIHKSWCGLVGLITIIAESYFCVKLLKFLTEIVSYFQEYSA